MQLFISVLHEILFTVIAVMLFGIIVGGWPPWIYNRNKKKLIKCHIMNIPTMGMEFFLSHMQSQKTIFEISANQ